MLTEDDIEYLTHDPNVVKLKNLYTFTYDCRIEFLKVTKKIFISSGNVSLYVMLIRTEVRKNFHNLLILLNTFEIVSFWREYMNTTFSKKLASFLLLCLGLSGFLIQSIFTSPTYTKWRTASQSEHDLHLGNCPCRNGKYYAVNWSFT